MLKEHLIPVAKKLREQAVNMEKEEEEFHAETRRVQHRKDSGEVEIEIQEVRSSLEHSIYYLVKLLNCEMKQHSNSTIQRMYML